MIVDASVIVEYLGGGPGARAARSVLAADGDSAAPHLLDAEVGHALRREVLRGRISAARATAAIIDLELLGISRVGHGAIMPRAWALRDNLSFYDALYVALAEALDTPLVTFDARLAAAPGHDAEILLLSA